MHKYRELSQEVRTEPQGTVGHGEEFGVYPEGLTKPLERLQQDSELTSFIFLKCQYTAPGAEVRNPGKATEMGQVSQVSLTQPRMGAEQMGGLEQEPEEGRQRPTPRRHAPSSVLYPSTFIT